MSYKVGDFYHILVLIKPSQRNETNPDLKFFYGLLLLGIGCLKVGYFLIQLSRDLEIVINYLLNRLRLLSISSLKRLYRLI